MCRHMEQRAGEVSAADYARRPGRGVPERARVRNAKFDINIFANVVRGRYQVDTGSRERGPARNSSSQFGNEQP